MSCEKRCEKKEKNEEVQAQTTRRGGRDKVTKGSKMKGPEAEIGRGKTR